jgi:hypothetical protein
VCGDLEEDDIEAERRYAAFLEAAHAEIHEAIEHRGGSRGWLKTPGEDQPSKDLSDEALHGYMDGLFADILNACIKDSRGLSGTDRYRVLTSQAVVLARVAGFLAGKLDPGIDPLRTSIEALMTGYGSER